MSQGMTIGTSLTDGYPDDLRISYSWLEDVYFPSPSTSEGNYEFHIIHTDPVSRYYTVYERTTDGDLVYCVSPLYEIFFDEPRSPGVFADTIDWATPGSVYIHGLEYQIGSVSSREWISEFVDCYRLENTAYNPDSVNHTIAYYHVDLGILTEYSRTIERTNDSVILYEFELSTIAFVLPDPITTTSTTTTSQTTTSTISTTSGSTHTSSNGSMASYIIISGVLGFGIVIELAIISELFRKRIS